MSKSIWEFSLLYAHSLPHKWSCSIFTKITPCVTRIKGVAGIYNDAGQCKPPMLPLHENYIGLARQAVKRLVRPVFSFRRREGISMKAAINPTSAKKANKDAPHRGLGVPMRRGTRATPKQCSLETQSLKLAYRLSIELL